MQPLLERILLLRVGEYNLLLLGNTISPRLAILCLSSDNSIPPCLGILYPPRGGILFPKPREYYTLPHVLLQSPGGGLCNSLLRVVNPNGLVCSLQMVWTIKKASRMSATLVKCMLRDSNLELCSSLLTFEQARASFVLLLT